MALRKAQTRGQVDIALDVSPEIVDAGADVILRARVSCSPAGDLTGHKLLLKDSMGADAGVLELVESDDEDGAAGTLALKAPLEIGEHVWSAVCPAVVKEGVSYDEASKAISFTVKPHAIRVLAWDGPATVVAGDRFAIKIGIKCSNECGFAHKAFDIHGHDGAAIAKGGLSDKIWPGTSGLYFAMLELQAPAAAGLYEWSVKCAGTDLELPHAQSAASFSVRVVARPEFLVTVAAVDRLSQKPLAGARVALHPYQAVTDERGFAEIMVTKGAYHLFVAQKAYLTLGIPVEVMSSTSARMELDPEPEIERN